jgi:hypothetical protein
MGTDVAATGGTAGSSLPAVGGTSTQGLAPWAAGYITDYLGKAQALANTPYQTYKGPLTAGASDLQTKAFQGIGNLSVPNNGMYTSVGGTFASPGTITVGGADSGAGGQGSSQVQQYMNPYLEAVLNPQLDALRRQSQINQNAIGAKFAGSGAFGGGRQAIGQAQANAALARDLNQTVGQGYASAFDAAQQQFNTEQQRKIQESQFGANFGLQGLAANRALLEQMAGMGETQRGITSEGIAADKAEFEKQREYPFKQIQFQQNALAGLPTSSVSNQPAQLSGIAQLLASLGGIESILKTTGQGSIADIFKSSGLGDLFKGLFSTGGGDGTTATPTGTGAGTGTGGIK